MKQAWQGNVEAIKLLDFWLSMPEINENDLGEGIRRRLDENRLSDRNKDRQDGQDKVRTGKINPEHLEYPC